MSKFNPSKRKEEENRELKEITWQRDYYLSRYQEANRIKNQFYNELMNEKKKVLQWRLIAITSFIFCFIELLVIIFG